MSITGFYDLDIKKLIGDNSHRCPSIRDMELRGSQGEFYDR
jgi:hypothetical protein